MASVLGSLVLLFSFKQLISLNRKGGLLGKLGKQYIEVKNSVLFNFGKQYFEVKDSVLFNKGKVTLKFLKLQKLRTTDTY